MIPCGPAADGLDVPHWEGLRDGALKVQRCAGCRAWLWGPRHICPSCHGFELGWEDVEPAGTVFSWCRTHHPYMPEFPVPYVSLVVALPQGVRLLGVLTGDEAGLRIGAPVTGHIDHRADAEWPLLRWSLS